VKGRFERGVSSIMECGSQEGGNRFVDKNQKGRSNKKRGRNGKEGGLAVEQRTQSRG